MGTINSITYRLALTKVQVNSSVTVIADKYGPDSTKAVADATMNTVGDPTGERTLTIRNTAIRDLSASFALTDDLRLASTSSESTGQLGAALSKTLGVASTIVGVAIAAAAIAEPPPSVEEEYLKAHEKLAKRRSAYSELLIKVSGQLLSASEQLADATSEDMGALTARRRCLRALRNEIEDEIARLDKHYDLWRNSGRSVRTEQRTMEFRTDQLPELELDGQLDPATLTAQHAKAWEELGALVTIHKIAQEPPPQQPAEPPAQQPTQAPAQQPTQGGDEDGIWLRVPRPVTWQLWRREREGDVEKAVPVHRGAANVVDGKCNHQFIAFRRSLWARRATKVEFSESGAIKTFESAAASSVAAAAAAVGELPAAVQGGLESASKMNTAWYGLQDAKADHELARLKAEVELKEQELKAAGLAATGGRYAELEALKQQVALADAQMSLDPTTRATEQLQGQTAFANAQREKAVADRQLEAESELSDLRLEIERLKAQWQIEHPGGA